MNTTTDTDIPRLDKRTLPREAQEAMRLGAVQRVLEGESAEEVARTLDVARSGVYRWVKNHREGGVEALRRKKAPGRARLLTDAQIEFIRSVVLSTSPPFWCFPTMLWTRAMVAELVWRAFGVDYSVEGIGRLMRVEMKLSVQRPVRRAAEAEEGRVKEWLLERYPAIREKAHESGARIYFADEAGVRSDYHAGTSWAAVGQTPVVESTDTQYAGLGDGDVLAQVPQPAAVRSRYARPRQGQRPQPAHPVRHRAGALRHHDARDRRSDTPDALRPAFRAIHAGLQQSGSINEFTVLDGRLLVAVDGTGTYSSTRVRCPSCCVKRRTHTNEDGTEQVCEECYHQLLAAAVVHPDKSTALMLDFEPIVKGDGQTKNDSERSAAKRRLPSIRAQYPKRRLCIAEDALAANAPHLRTLRAARMDYLIVAKPGSVPTLFELLDACQGTSLSNEWETAAMPLHTSGKKLGNGDTIVHGYRITCDVPFGTAKENRDLLVHSIETWGVHTIDGIEREVRNGHWITSIRPTKENAAELVAAGRTRWKIENECFNALKNQGCHLEHNYGHGKQHLSSTLGGLNLLAFLIEQVQESFCRVFQAVRTATVSRRKLWERLRSCFTTGRAPDWGAFIAYWEKPSSANLIVAAERIGTRLASRDDGTGYSARCGRTPEGHDRKTVRRASRSAKGYGCPVFILRVTYKHGYSWPGTAGPTRCASTGGRGR